MPYVQIGIAVFSMAVRYIFSKKPKRNELTAPWENLSFPEADLGSPIPVVFGTRWLNNANVVWYGDLKSRNVRVKEGGKK